MFLDSSRYFEQETVEISSKDGKKFQAITIRKLPAVPGKHHSIKGNDRLDIISQNNYNSGTKFWYIADSNTELEANNLVKTPGRIINVPDN